MIFMEHAKTQKFYWLTIEQDLLGAWYVKKYMEYYRIKLLVVSCLCARTNMMHPCFYVIWK